MNKKVTKCIIMLLCTIFIWTGNMTTYAAETADPETSDLKPLELYQIDESYGDLDEAAMSISDSSSGTALSGVYRTNWDSYGDDYCYQNLSTTWQELYDEMNLYCTAYMNTCVDAKVLSVNGRAVSGIGPIRYEGLTSEELSSLVYIFTYQNPQFYFIKNALYYNSKVVYLGVYDTFADGDTRSDVSVQLYNKIDAWVAEVNQKSTQYDKEKAAHDIVCDQVVYQEGTYSQSAYSAVIEGKTVCAGYAKLYSILTNAAGLETVSVTSATHGWNRTKLGDRWYNVDTTWDDGSTGNYFTYTYFNKSDATMKSYDGYSRESHTQNSYYDAVAPACPLDYLNGVTNVEATALSIDNPDIVLNLDGNRTTRIVVTFTPLRVNDKRLDYEISNSNVAIIDSYGNITAVNPGETDITVKKRSNNLKTTCHVTVYAEQAVPTAPVVVSKTDSQITLDTQSGCVYSVDGIHWQSSPAFVNLKPNTEYTFYVKRPTSGYYRESKAVSVRVRTLTEEVQAAPAVTVRYRTHVQTYGWQKQVTNGTMSGTSGQAKRLEGIEIAVSGNRKLGIQYTTHCQTYGWLPWSSNGEMNGTEGEAKRLEAIKIQLTGADKDKYDVYYRVHAQSYGWLGWAKNGAPAGTAGYAKRLEGIQIVVVKRGMPAPEVDYAGVYASATVRQTASYIAKNGTSPVLGSSATTNANPTVSGENTVNVAYRTHVQTYGWQGWKYNGQMSGTSGQAKRLEGICIKLTNKPYSGNIVYTTHVQTYGWEGKVNDVSTWKQNGVMSGTSGRAKRLEAICINLTGEMAVHYDVYYRVHAQTYGWLGWSKNGAPAGTAGMAKRLEGIQIVLVPKNGAAPSVNYHGIRSVQSRSYIQR